MADWMNPAGSVIGSLIGAGADIYMNQQNNKFNAQQSELNRRFQTSEREASQDWNLEMWNRSNAYNTPEAQINRLLEAGFNPVTAMSMMSESGNVTTPPTTSPQSGSQASAAGLAQPGSQLSNAVAQAANVAKTVQETKGLSIENEWKPKEKKANISNLESQAKAAAARANLDDASTKQVLELTPLLVKKTSQEIEQLKANIANTAESTKKITQEIENLKKEIELMDKQGQVLEEDVKLKKEQALKTLQERLYDEWRNGIINTKGFDPNAPLTNMITQLAVSGNYRTVTEIIDNILKSISNTSEDLPSVLSQFFGMQFEPTYYGLQGKLGGLEQYPFLKYNLINPWNPIYHFRNFRGSGKGSHGSGF